MNGDLISTTAIRQRGQLTIPKKLRKRLDWLSEGSLVSVLVTLGKEVKILPYQKEISLDWRAVWDGIKLARSFRGKKGNLSRFILNDRSSH